MNEYKNNLRTSVKDRLTTVSPTEVGRQSDVITQVLTQTLDLTNVTTALLYSPRQMPPEVDISTYQTWLESQDILCERVSVGKDAAQPTGKYNLIVVPMLGFDAQCYRLGNGGGWYDTFLLTQPAALKVGVALEEGLLPDIGHEVHDIAMDMVITSTKTYRSHGKSV